MDRGIPPKLPRLRAPAPARRSPPGLDRHDVDDPPPDHARGRLARAQATRHRRCGSWAGGCGALAARGSDGVCQPRPDPWASIRRGSSRTAAPSSVPQSATPQHGPCAPAMSGAQGSFAFRCPIERVLPIRRYPLVAFHWSNHWESVLGSWPTAQATVSGPGGTSVQGSAVPTERMGSWLGAVMDVPTGDCGAARDGVAPTVTRSPVPTPATQMSQKTPRRTLVFLIGLNIFIPFWITTFLSRL